MYELFIQILNYRISIRNTIHTKRIGNFIIEWVNSWYLLMFDSRVEQFAIVHSHFILLLHYFFCFFLVHISIDSWVVWLSIRFIYWWNRETNKAIVTSAYPLEESFIHWNAVCIQNVSISIYTVLFYCIFLYLLLYSTPISIAQASVWGQRCTYVDAGRYYNGASEIGEWRKEEYFIQIVGIPDYILPFDQDRFPFTPSAYKLLSWDEEHPSSPCNCNSYTIRY